MILAMDTSTRVSSVALFHLEQVVAELTWYSEENQTVELLPNVSFLLSQRGWSTTDISGVAVAIGPGSFNGLRVSMGTAKGLALALGIPLVGISTLEAQAYAHSACPIPVCALLDARAGEVAFAVYQTREGEWGPIIPEQIIPVAALEGHIKEHTLFCGEITPALAADIRDRLGWKAIFAPPSSLRRAGFLAEIGWRRIQAGHIPPLSDVQPLYLRRPAIKRKEPSHD